jgi:endonuclease/exonuclease/phosphatase family metal-dependent hydrolase
MTQSVRIATYNIHKCIGRDGKYDPGRTTEVLASLSADIICLQEVDDGAKRSNRERLVDQLGDRLQLPHRAFAVNVSLRSGGGYGNAILSRWPIVDSENIDVTTPMKKRRSLLRAAVHTPHQLNGSHLHVFCAHLGLAQYERKLQLSTIVKHPSIAHLSSEAAVVMAGDFNDVWGNLVKRLAPHGFRGMESSPSTFPAGLPMRALDRVFVRGAAHIVGVERGDCELAKIASDHRPLVVTVATQEPPLQ